MSRESVVQNQPQPPTFSPLRGGLLQRKCACGQHTVAGGECAECRKKQLQRKASNHTDPETAPPIVHEVLRSPGQPLDAETRAFMEPRFGHDFSQVRVHTDEKAAESARAVNALAYTIGRNVVFGVGQYQMRTSYGQHLLAHELTHVIQQSGDQLLSPVGINIGPTDDQYEHQANTVANQVLRSYSSQPKQQISTTSKHLLRRTPEASNTRERWGNFTTTRFTGEAPQQRVAQEAINRLLMTAAGQRLVNNLWGIFCRGRERCRSTINISFVDQLEAEFVEVGASGYFEPDSPDQAAYNVFAQNRAPVGPGSRGRTLGGSWPGGTDIDIHYTHGDPESSLASTLYHELLHIWFIHAERDAPFPTGHGDVSQGQIAPIFYRRLRDFHRDMDAVESRIRREAEANRRETNLPPSSSLESLDIPESTTSRETSSRPTAVGGAVSLRAGGAGGVASGFSGVIGADLILGRINALRVGARGIYLTPDRLLAGGSIGTRILQSGDDRYTNPLFFDIEAGVLGEITPTEAGRITNNIAFMGSAGIGQEFGQSGTRFFWRIGGFVIVTDRGEGIGGGTVGTGVRFQ